MHSVLPNVGKMNYCAGFWQLPANNVRVCQEKRMQVAKNWSILIFYNNRATSMEISDNSSIQCSRNRDVENKILKRGTRKWRRIIVQGINSTSQSTSRRFPTILIPVQVTCNWQKFEKRCYLQVLYSSHKVRPVLITSDRMCI